MTEESHYRKYKKTMDEYSKSLYRSTFAIKRELGEPLQSAVKELGVRSLSELLTLIALGHVKFAHAMGPVIKEAKVKHGLEKTSRVEIMRLINEANSSGLSAQEITQALAVAALRKQGVLNEQHVTAN